MFAFAMSRIRDPGAAQDAVQETFLAALKAPEQIAGASSERAWLMGVLRHKIYDHFRRQTRQPLISDLENPDGGDIESFQNRGLGKDGWVKDRAPRGWTSPDESLDRKEFQAAFRRCLGGLPELAAMVFRLREVDEMNSDQICQELNLTPNNFWVIMHRSRLALRRCLELHWF